MKLLLTAAAGAVLAIASVSAAIAGPASGDITLLGPALADTPLDVEVSLDVKPPVVPYEYSIVNKCWLDGSTSGHYDSYERQDLIGPWFIKDGLPTTTVTINLQLVTAGARCKVYVVNNNTAVKGTTEIYDVGP